MSLADFEPRRVKVVIREEPRTEISVRGLTTDDLSILINDNLADLQRLYTSVAAEGGVQEVMARLSANGFIIKLISLTPVLASVAIALASDEPEAVRQARLLPLPVQASVLYQVVRLTFEDVGGPKAFVALVSEMVGMELPEAVGKATIQ